MNEVPLYSALPRGGPILDSSLEWILKILYVLNRASQAKSSPFRIRGTSLMRNIAPSKDHHWAPGISLL